MDKNDDIDFLLDMIRRYGEDNFKRMIKITDKCINNIIPGLNHSCHVEKPCDECVYSALEDIQKKNFNKYITLDMTICRLDEKPFNTDMFMDKLIDWIESQDMIIGGSYSGKNDKDYDSEVKDER